VELSSVYATEIGNYFIIEDEENKYVIDTDNLGSIISLTNCNTIQPTSTPTSTPTVTPVPATATPTPLPATSTPTPTPTPILYTYGIDYTENPTPYDACQRSSHSDYVYTTDSNPLSGSTIFYYDSLLTTPYITTNNGYYSTLFNDNNDVFALTTDIITGVFIGFIFIFEN
jgi:hypothetical protein